MTPPTVMPLFTSLVLIEEQYKEAHTNITNMVNSQISVGTEVRWKYGPFRGRLAVIREVYWGYEHWRTKGVKLNVEVLVKTYRLDGRETEEYGKFLSTSDTWHHRYHKVDSVFERATSNELYIR